MSSSLSTLEEGITRTVEQNTLYITVGILLLLFAVNWSALGSLYVFWWQSATYSHGLLLVPISVFLIWSNRHRLRDIQIKPSLLALILFGIAELIWWISFIVDIAVVQQLLLLVTVMLVWWSCLGASALRLFVFPLVLPLIAIPLWDPVEPILQLLTVIMSAAGLELSGVPVHIQGYYITIPAGSFEIKEVCAGLRFFLAALTVASLFAYLYLRALKWRMIFVLTALLLAIVNNWIRVYAVVLAAHETNMQHHWVDDHVGLGWWLFVLMQIPLFVFGYFLHKHEEKSLKDGDNKYNSAKYSYVAINSSAIKPVMMYSVILLIIIGTAASANWIKYGQSNMYIDMPPLSIPSKLSSWQDAKINRDSWRPVSVGADETLYGIYENSYKEKVYVYAARYKQQYQGKELINYNNSISNPILWRAEFLQERQIKIENIERLLVSEYKLLGVGGQERLVWSFYVVNGTATNSALKAKILQIGELLGARKGAHIVAFSAQVTDSEDRSRRLLADYIEDVFPTLKTIFGITS